MAALGGFAPPQAIPPWSRSAFRQYGNCKRALQTSNLTISRAAATEVPRISMTTASERGQCARAAAGVTSAPAISYPAADRAAASRRALDRLAAQQGGEARRCCRDDAHYRSLEPERGIGDRTPGAPPANAPSAAAIAAALISVPIIPTRRR